MTAPSRGRDDATIRGAVVLVVAIVIGLALLWRSGAGDDETTAPEQDSATETPFTGDTSTDSDGNTMPVITPTSEGSVDTQPPESVTVIVFNGTPDRVPNIAGEYTDKAAAEGYEVLTPTNAAASTDTTTIYTAVGFELDAEAMRDVMGLPEDTVVSAKPEQSLGTGDDLADIVVVLGSDYGGASGGATTDTTADEG